MNEPNESAAEEKFVGQAKSLFDSSVAGLDAASLSRLNQARHAALDSAHGRARSTVMLSRWVPLTGVAAAALLVTMVMRAPEIASLPADSVADFEILLEGENFEMYEDLEFYSWLEPTDLDAYGNAG